MSGETVRSGYGEYDRSAPYLHLLSLPMWPPLRPRLAAALASVDPSAGTILELGPGSGIGTEVVLDAVPGAPVLAAEPSAALRAILLARLAGRLDADRLTVYPAGAADVPLPDRLAAVIGLHMIGHLAPKQRRGLWPALADRPGRHPMADELRDAGWRCGDRRGEREVRLVDRVRGDAGGGTRRGWAGY